MRILLAEDNKELRDAMREGLEKADFAVDGFELADEADAAVSTTKYDAVILDLGLPDGDGIDLLRSWRDRGETVPVLILTARDTLADRVKGLDSGADDYLAKPFAMEEVLARIRALLRRPGAALGVVLVAGNITFDVTSREVRIADVPVPIPRREMAVLEQLMRRMGNVVPKDLLADSVYSFDDDVTSNSLEVGISRLRKRLAKVGATVSIHTLRGVGYLMTEEEAAA
ncbi:MAG: response regulator [Rickettsiales bacterium]